MTEQYHEIFLPLVDVYRAGGTEVFSSLERTKDNKRNLIVIPRYFTTYLQDLKDKKYDAGSGDALTFLKNAVSKHLHTRDEEMSIYRVAEGLDIAILDKPREKGEEKPSVTELEKIIIEKWNLKDQADPDGVFEHKKPTIMTSVEDYYIKYKGRGMKAEDPAFLIVNSDIVNEGIILGND